MLYGSLRERSYSRFATLEAERLLRHFGCETRVFHATGLPLPDDAEASHPKVQELREASTPDARFQQGLVDFYGGRYDGAVTAMEQAVADALEALVSEAAEEG